MRSNVLLICAAALLSSCNASISGPADEPNSQMKTGSTYTFDSYLVDEINFPVSGSSKSLVSTVLQVDKDIGGKQDVVVLEDRIGSSRDTSYYAYESDGSFSILFNKSKPSMQQWLKLPVEGGGAGSVTTIDSVAISGKLTIIQITSTCSDYGKSSVYVGQDLISTAQVKTTSHEVWTREGNVIYDEMTEGMMHYAPRFGRVIQRTTVPHTNSTGGKIYGQFESLLSYTLK
jgi:hypothetical protein